LIQHTTFTRARKLCKVSTIECNAYKVYLVELKYKIKGC